MAKKKAAKKKAQTQSERFIAAAKAAGVDESGKDFARALDALLPAPKKKR